MKRNIQVVKRTLTQYAKGVVAALLLLLFAACGGVTQAPTLDTLAATLATSEHGLVVEAEAFHAKAAKGKHQWKARGDAMYALPDVKTTYNSNFTLRSPRLDYRISVEQPGTYYVWVKGMAAGSSKGSSDSVHVGLNGKAVRSADRISGFGTRFGWKKGTMDGPRAKLKLSAGTHTLNVWMREDGFAFDKLVLTRDASAKPAAVIKATENEQEATSGPALPVPSSKENTMSLPRVKAKSAGSFIDSIGVNTHLHYQGTVYDKRYEDLIKPKLLELGVRHIRDGAYTYEEAGRNTFFYKRLRELGAAGIDFNLLTSLETPYNDATDYSKLDDVVSWTDGAVTSFEGINEPDLQGISGWVNLTRDAQKKLYGTVRGNPALKDVKVLGPSPVWKAKDLGDLSRYMDYGNTHPYPGGKMPTGSEYGQSTQTSMVKASRNSGVKPVMFTETGYHNALKTDNDHAPTSEAATAKYLPRMLLAHFNMGVPRTYLYELIDSKSKGRSTDPEASFGLLRNDGSEKPAFRAVENLIDLLEDSGTFTPGALNFSLSGSADDVHQTLLQKRDGTFYLALWSAKESWDRDSREDVRVNAQNVTVTLGSDVKNVTLHTLNGAGRMSKRAVSLQNGLVELKVGDSVTVLELR